MPDNLGEADSLSEADLVAMERDLERDLAQHDDQSGASLTDRRDTCA